MSGEDVQVDDWVVHRPNVVRSVAARVPGIDAEEATSRALEKMVRIVSTGGTIDDPAPYWRRAAVNEAISMTREAGRTHAVEDDTLDGLTPPVAGAELDAERQADVSMLRTALSDLADDDRKILLDRHVHDMAVTDIATGLGVRPHAVTMRLRRAEERLAGAFAAAHAQDVNEPECRTTRAAMHDYLKGHLLPRRQRRLEVHMDGCGECTRAFIDVREVSWMLRDLGQHLIAGGLLTSAAGTTAIGTTAAGGSLGATKPRSFGTKHAAVAAGVLAALVIGAGAAALIAGLPASMSIQAVGEPPPTGVSDAPATNPPRDPAPPQASAEPTDPPRTPRPADEKSHPPPAAELVTAPVAAVEPATVAKPHERPNPESPAEPPRATPAPEKPKPAEPEPAEPETPPAKPNPGKPATPPTPDPPDKGQMGGPPGNPGNEHGKGPGKDNNQGPGKGHGSGNGNGNGKGPGPGHGHAKGPGHGNGNGQSSGKGQGPGADHDRGKGPDHGKSSGHGKGPGSPRR